MVEWVGSRQVGLSKYQTAGEVGGSYVVRPSGSDVATVYRPGVGSTSIMVEGGATAGRGGIGTGTTTTIRRDLYGNVIGVKQTSPTGQTIFERRTTLGGGAVEEGLPFGVQPRYADIERTRFETPLYRRQAEYRAREETKRQQEAATPRRAAFQLPIFQQYQNRYQPPPKRYYAVSYPSGFGSEKVAHEYKPGEKFKAFGIIPYGEPKPGKLYKSDILGFTREAGEVKEESIRSAMERGALEGVSTTDIKLRQLGNMLAVSPFIIKYPYLKPSVSIKSKGKPPLEKIFGTKEYTSQKKVFSGEKYYVEPKTSLQPTKSLYRQMFGGTTKPAPKVNVLKNMFGSAAYQKPRKTTVMDILLVQPQRQRQIVRPVESMWRQVIAKPSELKPRTDFEAVYQQQAVRNILQYTKLSKVAKPTPQITVAKPVKTYGVMEQIRLESKVRLSPQAFKPALRTISGTQYKFMLGMGASSRLLSGLMQGQRQEQILGQQFQQKQAQAQKQRFRQRFAFDYKIKYPELTKISTSLQPQHFLKTPARQPPRQPPRTPPQRQPPRREPPFFIPPKVPPIYIPSFEAPSIFGKAKEKTFGIKSKIIKTRMLSLKDILG